MVENNGDPLIHGFNIQEFFVSKGFNLKTINSRG